MLFNMNLSIIYHRSSLWSILLSSWRCHLVWIKSNHLHCCSNQHQLQRVPLTAVWMECHHVRRVAEIAPNLQATIVQFMTMKSQEKYFRNIDSILLWSEDSGYWLWHCTRGPMVLNSDNVFVCQNITWLCCALVCCNCDSYSWINLKIFFTIASLAYSWFPSGNEVTLK